MIIALNDVVNSEVQDFKNRVLRYRTDERMTYSELASYCEMDEGTCYNALNNVKKESSFRTLRKISLGTGVPLFTR